MSAKQDRQGARTVTDLERKYNFGQRFAEILGVATDAQDAALAAAEAIKQFNENLTPEQIFDLLTGGGADQGVYREDGKIYLNANYIKTGFISSDLIKAGVIRSLDYEEIPVDEIYPSPTLYPYVRLYPTDGKDIVKGMEIDFEAGVIRVGGSSEYAEKEYVDAELKEVNDSLAQVDESLTKIEKSSAIESTDYTGCYYRIVDGVTEWLNPPMVQGTEYRTAERFKNKVVYAKSINFGTLPNSTTKEVSSGLKSSYTVVEFTFLQSDSNAVSSIVDYSQGGCSCWLGTNKTKIVCSTTYDMSGTSGLVYLKYTK